MDELADKSCSWSRRRAICALIDSDGVEVESNGLLHAFPTMFYVQIGVVCVCVCVCVCKRGGVTAATRFTWMKKGEDEEQALRRAASVHNFGSATGNVESHLTKNRVTNRSRICEDVGRDAAVGISADIGRRPSLGQDLAGVAAVVRHKRRFGGRANNGVESGVECSKRLLPNFRRS